MHVFHASYAPRLRCSDQNLEYIFLPVEIVVGLGLLGLALLGCWSRLGQFRGSGLGGFGGVACDGGGCLDYLAAAEADGFGHGGHRWHAVVCGGIRAVGDVVADEFADRRD
jgi:hypothetical protein